MDEKLKLMAIKGTYNFNGREEMCINFSAIEEFFSKKKRVLNGVSVMTTTTGSF
jgi:hypothetical protein